MNKPINNRARYAIVMVISVLMNQILYTIALDLNLPVWLDITGTALAAMVLEPTAGLLVGLVNNFYLAVFIYDSSSLIFYAVSVAVALIVGLNLRRNGKLDVKRVLPTILMVLCASTLLSASLDIIRSGSVPSSAWEIKFYQYALDAGVVKELACLFGVFVIKVFDTFASAGVVALAYYLLPKSLKFAPEAAKPGSVSAKKSPGKQTKSKG